jgi:hypothetical protein
LKRWTARSVFFRDIDNRMTERQKTPMTQTGTTPVPKTGIDVLP